MKKWKIWTGIGLVFLAGICIGAVGSGLYVRHEVRAIFQGGSPVVTQLVTKRLTRVLDLSGTQRDEIAVIVGQTQARLRELRLRNRPETERIITDGIDRMKERLTPRQQEKLDLLYRRLQQRWGAGALPPTL